MEKDKLEKMNDLINEIRKLEYELEEMKLKPTDQAKIEAKQKEIEKKKKLFEEM